MASAAVLSPSTPSQMTLGRRTLGEAAEVRRRQREGHSARAATVVN
ncbi:MAG: hypothetical protein R2851_00810 [Caldilineaceae bacterium]